MATPIERLERHVLDIAKEHDIAVVYCSRPDGARAMREFDEIVIPRIRSEISYATAMHELGHMLGRFRNSASTMVRERWAWRWAERNALLWTARMGRSRDKSLEWYAPRAKAIDAKHRRWLAEAIPTDQP
jgi:hypothetical protein